jgi:type III pantothenate kinase
LGSDRWSALIGARSLEKGPCLVVCAGTALTADALDADGRFLGGIIAPGLRLMQRALADNTAALQIQQGAFAPFPDNTADALHSGALQALVGAVERMLRQLEAQVGQTPRCLASGGDAPLLLPLLPPHTQHVENLVLEGLIRMARP